MLYTHSLNSQNQQGFYDITDTVREYLVKSGVTDGLCVVYCPHTTAAVTINVNTDPNVSADLLFQLERSFPDRNDFLHLEGNSAAHLKSSVIGPSVSIPVEGGRLALGQWQSIFFCEFDGPRARSFRMQFIAG